MSISSLHFTQHKPIARLTWISLALALVFGAGCATTEPTLAQGSIAEALGVSELSVVSLQQLEHESNLAYERHIAECMRNEGFEYVIESQPSPVLVDRAGTTTEVEFVERFGWGIVYAMTERDRQLAEIAAVSENARIYAELGPREREAYDLARRGNSELDAESDESAEGECPRFARNAIREELPGVALLEQYEIEIEDTVERFSTDLRIIAFDREWSACMREFRFDYVRPQAMSNDIADRVRNPSAASTRVAWIEEVRDHELEAAAASLECGIGPAVYGQPEIYTRVLDSLEQRFLAENPGFGS